MTSHFENLIANKRVALVGPSSSLNGQELGMK